MFSTGSPNKDTEAAIHEETLSDDAAAIAMPEKLGSRSESSGIRVYYDGSGRHFDGVAIYSFESDPEKA